MDIYTVGVAGKRTTKDEATGNNIPALKGDAVHIEFKKAPFQLTFEQPWCEPAHVYVHGFFGQVKKSDGTRRPNDELHRQLMYTGVVGCCSKTFFWPAKEMVRVEDRKIIDRFAKQAFVVDFFWGCDKWSREGESMRIMTAEFSSDEFWRVNGERDELPLHDQRWLASEQHGQNKMHRQRLIASVKDPLYGENLNPQNQCCMQKVLAHSYLYDGDLNPNPNPNPNPDTFA